MANRISRSMVALSASAVASIYAAGFIMTRSADAGLGAVAGTVTPAAVVATATAQPAGNTVVVGASASASAPSTSTPVASSAPVSAAGATASAYKDGTFAGQGTSRRGGVSVSVSIQGGTITNVQITSVSTQYPVSRIASLPGAVVKQQTASVNVISGATYSSQAFTQAVQQALTQARVSSAAVG